MTPQLEFTKHTRKINYTCCIFKYKTCFVKTNKQHKNGSANAEINVNSPWHANGNLASTSRSDVPSKNNYSHTNDFETPRQVLKSTFFPICEIQVISIEHNHHCLFLLSCSIVSTELQLHVCTRSQRSQRVPSKNGRYSFLFIAFCCYYISILLFVTNFIWFFFFPVLFKIEF